MDLNSSLSPLIVNLPVIITIIALTRYIIGLKTWKNYTSLALALGFFFIHLATNSPIITMITWLGLTLIILGAAILSRYLMRKLSMNYYSRIAMMYLAAMVAFYIIALATRLAFNSSFFYAQNILLGAFLIGSTVDDLANLQFKKSPAEFLRRLVTASLLGLIGGLLLTWEWWNVNIASRLEILILVLFINIIVANWKNLRITEIIRFRSVIK